MTFLYPGDYIFEVSEIIPDEKDRDPRIDYDTHRETVVVRIKETEGALTATVLYDSDGPLFTNDLDGASAYITVHKILLGGEIQEGQFRFEMEEISRPIHARPTMVGKYTAVNSAVDEQEEVIDTYSGAISANPWIGTAPVRFDELIFITPGVYRYRINRAGQSMSVKQMQKYAENYDHVLDSLLRFYDSETVKNCGTEKRRYIANIIARTAAARIRIFLSLPTSRENKEALIRFDEGLKKNHPEIYRANINKAVNALRKSNYLLYRPAAAAVKEKYGQTTV